MKDKDIAYRVAFETANLELTLIQAAMTKLQREKGRIENALAREPEIVCVQISCAAPPELSRSASTGRGF